MKYCCPKCGTETTEAHALRGKKFGNLRYPCGTIEYFIYMDLGNGLFGPGIIESEQCLRNQLYNKEEIIRKQKKKIKELKALVV